MAEPDSQKYRCHACMVEDIFENTASEANSENRRFYESALRYDLRRGPRAGGVLRSDEDSERAQRKQLLYRVKD